MEFQFEEGDIVITDVEKSGVAGVPLEITGMWWVFGSEQYFVQPVGSNEDEKPTVVLAKWIKRHESGQSN